MRTDDMLHPDAQFARYANPTSVEIHANTLAVGTCARAVEDDKGGRSLEAGKAVSVSRRPL